MRNTLTFGGTNLSNYGLYISGQGTFAASARAYDFRRVPGRNGDILTADMRLENGQLTYPCFINRNFNANIQSLRNFLMSKIGYQRIEDTYHPDEFRLGVYAEAFEPTVNNRNDGAEFELTFNVKPQRYLVSGETDQEFTASGYINNPTLMPAEPLIRVYGTGRITVNGTTINCVSNTEYTDIDCELKEAFEDGVSRNDDIKLTNNTFPTLKAGSNRIYFYTTTTDLVTKVVITPRWWRV